jgi:NitT/TauT family transport system substrate-binding protein
MALVMVAKDRNFFADEGLEVELKQFTAGKFALQAFLSRSIDFAVSGEVPVALATLQGNPLRVVSQVVENTTNEVRVVALRDPEAPSPRAYFTAKRRKLATSFGGGPEFFTYNFLQRHRIKDSDVEVISQKPEDMPAALESRSVDAIAIFDPFAFIAEKRMGARAVTFADSTLYSEFYVLAVRPEQLGSRASEIEGLIRGLSRAGDFIQLDPETAKEITRKYTKLDRDVIDGIWANFSFRPALVPKLIEYWDAQAEWARRTGKVTSETRPVDFHQIVDDRFLRKVAPEAVKLRIREEPVPGR